MITPVAILVNTCIKIYQEMGGRPVSERGKKDGPEGTSRETIYPCNPPVNPPKIPLREYLHHAYGGGFLFDIWQKLAPRAFASGDACALGKFAETCNQGVCAWVIGQDWGISASL